MVRLCGIVLFIFSLPVFSMPIVSIEADTVEFGILQYAIVKKSEKVKIIKNTNKFDSSQDIGEFEIENIKELKNEMDLFESRFNALVKVESLTQTSPVSQNSFKHQNFIKLGKYKIHPNDSYYSDLKLALNELMRKAKLKSVDSLGMKRNLENNCKKVDNDQIQCLSSEYGVLFK